MNNAPWPVTAKLELAISASTPLKAIGTRSVPALEKLAAGSSQWNVSLKPYDMLAAEFSAAEVKVTARNVEADPSVRNQLRQLVTETLARIRSLQQSPPLAALENTSFEAPPVGADTMPGWVHSSAVNGGGPLTLETNQPHSGGKCVRMEHAGTPAWLRSSPLPAPETGRIAILVWLRTADVENQPRVHLSLDYDHAGEHRYESKVAGAGSPHPLRTGWTPYVANFDDLPTELVTDLRVGVDVMTPGTVWLDDFEAFDTRFEPTERDQLMKIWALANFYLEQGRLGDCYHVLQGYWPRFLRESIPAAPEVAMLPADIPLHHAAPPIAPEPQPPKEEPAPGFFDRVKSYAPTKWLPFK